MNQPNPPSFLRSPRLLSALVALALFHCLVPMAASAQDDSETETNNGTILPDLIGIEGKDNDTLGEIWIGIADCERNADIVINLPDVPDKSSLDMYTGSACNSTSRNETDGGTKCTLVDSVSIDTTRDLEVTLKTQDLTSCDGDKSTLLKLWFLAVDSSGSSEDVMTNYGFIPINIDTDAPKAPTSVSGGSGQNQIPVRWSIGTEEVDGFYIYVDSGGGGGASDAAVGQGDDDAGADASSGSTNSECGSGKLIEGANAENLDDDLRKASPGKTATDYDLRPGQIDGDSAAVAVVAIDRAGNQSPLSEVVCVHVVPTDGFKDLYEQGAGHPIEQGCPCSAIGPAQAHTAWPVALALAFVARRRRRS